MFFSIQVLLDKCTAKSMISYSRACGEFQLDEDSEALICDVNIVTNVLLAWRVWEKTESPVWQTAFKAIEILLREDHPHRSFNIRQLQSAGMIEKMLNMCIVSLRYIHVTHIEGSNIINSTCVHLRCCYKYFKINVYFHRSDYRMHTHHYLHRSVIRWYRSPVS